MLAERRSLLDLTLRPGTAGRTLSDDARRVALDDLRQGVSLEGALTALRGRSVLIACEGQLTFTLAALALDGIARRILLCLPDLAAEHLPGVMADGEVDAVVTDWTGYAARPPRRRRARRRQRTAGSDKDVDHWRNQIVDVHLGHDSGRRGRPYAYETGILEDGLVKSTMEHPSVSAGVTGCSLPARRRLDGDVGRASQSAISARGACGIARLGTPSLARADGRARRDPPLCCGSRRKGATSDPRQSPDLSRRDYAF